MNEPEFFTEVSNPLDSLEDVFASQEWVFSRPHPDEIALQIAGTHGDYNLSFIWQEEHTAMQFTCEMDIAIPSEREAIVNEALRVLNSRIWLGHFDLPPESSSPCFRHTSLFRGWTHSSGADHIQGLMEIALSECERYYNIFALLAHNCDALDKDHLALALADQAGQA